MFHVEQMYNKMKKPTREKILAVRLHPETFEALNTIAESEGITTSWLVRYMYEYCTELPPASEGNDLQLTPAFKRHLERAKNRSLF